MAKISRARMERINNALISRGATVSWDDIHTLIFASRGLQRCFEFEQEFDDSNDYYYSWAIERDEETGKPYRVTHRHKDGNVARTRIRNVEASYTRRAQEVADRYGLHMYIQANPRGASIYLNDAPIGPTNYTNGVAIF